MCAETDVMSGFGCCLGSFSEVLYFSIVPSLRRRSCSKSPRAKPAESLCYLWISVLLCGGLPRLLWLGRKSEPGFPGPGQAVAGPAPPQARERPFLPRAASEVPATSDGFVSSGPPAVVWEGALLLVSIPHRGQCGPFWIAQVMSISGSSCQCHLWSPLAMCDDTPPGSGLGPGCLWRPHRLSYQT